MKKIFSYVLGVCVMLGSVMPLVAKPISVKIGDKGPAGGLVFRIEGSVAWEVSEFLGNKQWQEAFAVCTAHRQNSFRDWYLPSKEEHYLIYQNLGRSGKFRTSNWFWSSSTSGGRAYISILTNGNSMLMDKDRSYAVCAVRSFNLR